MNKKKKNIELKIYELLGIQTFKKILFKLIYVTLLPFTFFMTKEERKNVLYNTPSNYIMKKGNGIQDLRDFKKMLFLNAGIHICALLTFIPELLEVLGNTASLSTTIEILFWIPINTYCIMLQRYNQIRINQVIETQKARTEAKKRIVKEKIIEEKSLNDCTYQIVNKRGEEKNITFEELFENTTYEQLKQCRYYLSYFKQMNQRAEEQLGYYNSDGQSINIPLQKNKTLKLYFYTNTK